MKILLRFSFCFFLLVLSLTACSKSGKESSPFSKEAKQHITINITSEPQTLDPRKCRALSDVNLIRMFMEGLTRPDKSGESALALAKKVEVSPDQTTYTFTLRESYWSNGDLVTSHDFSYAWKKSLSPNFMSPNANLLYVIKNAKEVKNGKLPPSLLGIETPDEKTLVVTLTHPTPYFLELTSHPIYFPVSSSVDRANPHWAEKESSYVGNGPFTLAEWKHHNMMRAKKNDRYWDRKAVKLSDLKMVMVSEDTGFKMFDTRELNWDGSPFSKIPVSAIDSLKEANQLHSAPQLATQFLRVNVEKFPFESKEIRQAFAYAIDRQAIVEHITQGTQIPATGLVPSSMELTKSPYFKDHDVEKAKELFSDALNQIGTSPEKISSSIALLYVSNERNHLTAQALQSQWQEAFGIQVRLEPIERKVFFDRVSKKDYILSLGDWFADFNDPINFLEIFKTKDVGTNNTNWENPIYTELLESSYNCSSNEARLDILRQGERLLMEEMPCIPILHFTMAYVQDNHLKDVIVTSMGDIDFKWAHVE